MIIQVKGELPRRREYDFYPTPLPFAIAALKGLPTSLNPRYIMDPGAGTGVWGEASQLEWDKARVTGCEIRDMEAPDGYFGWWTKDFLDSPVPSVVMDTRFDLVMGNPPYRFAEEFVRHSLDFLRLGGWLVFMLRLSFLESKRRMQLWEDHPLRKVIVCANRPSFTGDGKTNATAYAFYYWQKGYRGPTDLSWRYIENGRE